MALRQVCRRLRFCDIELGSGPGQRGVDRRLWFSQQKRLSYKNSLHVPSMCWRSECVGDQFTPNQGLLFVKIAHTMTKFEYLGFVLQSIAIWLNRYTSERVHNIKELDIREARIQRVRLIQIFPDRTLSSDGPKPSSPFC